MKFEDLIIVKAPQRKKKAARKWPADPSDRGKLLARRRTGGIRFYDLGYMLDGAEYVNLPFVDFHSTEDIDDTAEIAGVATLTIDLFDDLNELIFAVTQEDWPTTFKQLDDTYIDNYGTTFGSSMFVTYKGTGYFLSSSTAWNGEIFRPNGAVTNDSFLFQANSRLFTSFSLNGVGSSSYKVTIENNYAADEVVFVPSNSMDVFLVPSFIDAIIQHVHDHTPHPLFPELVSYGETDALDNLRFVYPREVLFDESVEVYGEYLTGWNWSRAPIPEPNDTAAAYEDAYRMETYWKTFGGLRAGREVFVLGENPPSPPFPIPVANFQAEADFPAPPGRPPGVLGEAASGFINVTGTMNGALLAIIKQGASYYYVWRDV
jgi:hypothetical protein